MDDDGDDGLFEWALAHFRQNPVFSIMTGPANRLDRVGPVATRRGTPGTGRLRRSTNSQMSPK